MTGKRIAILGLGRSGLAIGRAALQLDALPQVYDEKPEESLPKRDVLEEARALGLPVTLGWQDEFEDPDFIVSNPAVPRTHPKLLAARERGISVISEVEFAYRISKAPIVAITGTNGKSTTTVMTYLCLRASGEDAVLCGNIFGSGYDEMPLTDAALNSTPDQILVAEISSFQLEWIEEFQPVSAGITNIWPDHLDRYDSFEDYAAVKQRIFHCQDEKDFAVVKANDPVVVPPSGTGGGYRPRHLRGSSSGQRPEGGASPAVLTFGASGQHARVDEIELTLLDKRVRLEDLPFDEPHNYQNACMAALLTYGALANKAQRAPESGAAQLLRRAEQQYREARDAKRSVYDPRQPEETPLRVMPMEIVEGLKSFRGLAHRMESVGEKGGVRVINNSMCTNPDAIIKSAQAVKDPAHLLIGGVNKSLDFKPLRHYLANGRNKAYLFGTDAEDLDKMLGGGYPVFETMEQAFRAATEQAQPGQAIMLAPGCASTDQFRDFRDRGNVFKAIAKEWLRS
jgi:UDP-N-acetylmuramoylalanine--D-glutamate ligase